jgi:putative SOS response-associated peptidase YedK
MPVILQSESADEWMSGSNELLETAAERAPALRAWPVSRRVNNARNQGEDLIDADGDRIA